MHRKTIIVFTSAIFIFGLLACSAVKDRVAQEIVEQVTGIEEIKIDESNGSTTIDIGDEVINITESEEGMAWPSGKLPAFVPQLKGATIVSTVDIGSQIWVNFEKCTKENAMAYANEMKTLGWEVIGEFEAQDSYTYSIQDEEGRLLQIGWNDDGSGILIYGEK